MPSSGEKAQHSKQSRLYIGLTVLAVAVVGLGLWATGVLAPEGKPTRTAARKMPATVPELPAPRPTLEPEAAGYASAKPRLPTADFDPSEPSPDEGDQHDGEAGEPKEHVQTPEEAVATIDRVLPRLEDALKQYEAAGNEERAQLVRIRIERLRRARAAYAADAGSDN